MLHEVSFTSYNERDQVQGWNYVPACKPNGIVQLIHGFGEHSRRYIHMISAFLDAGYIVAADDHVGHGKTAMVNNVWGDWGDKGCHTMMEDEHTLKKIVCEKYPDLPYFLFGHSMGSFITRDFIAKYGNELNGATICGTTGIFRGAKEVKEKLKEIIADVLNVEVNDITEDTTFVDDLGADSLDIFQIIMGIEETFDIEIDNDDAEQISTVGDAVEQIKNATNNN